MPQAVATSIASATTKNLTVSAMYTDLECKNPHYAEKHFANVVSNAVSPYSGRVSNCGAKDRTKRGWHVKITVWRQADSPFTEKPLNQDKETEKFLRKLATAISMPLATDYKDIVVALVTTVTTSEIL